MILKETEEFLTNGTCRTNDGYGEFARHDGNHAMQSHGTKGLTREQYRLTCLLFQKR